MLESTRKQSLKSKENKWTRAMWDFLIFFPTIFASRFPTTTRTRLRSRMAEQPAQDKEKKEEAEESKGYSFDCLKDPQKGKEFACSQCKGVARDAVEMVRFVFIFPRLFWIFSHPTSFAKQTRFAHAMKAKSPRKWHFVKHVSLVYWLPTAIYVPFPTMETQNIIR